MSIVASTVTHIWTARDCFKNAGNEALPALCTLSRRTIQCRERGWDGGTICEEAGLLSASSGRGFCRSLAVG